MGRGRGCGVGRGAVVVSGAAFGSVVANPTKPAPQNRRKGIKPPRLKKAVRRLYLFLMVAAVAARNVSGRRPAFKRSLFAVSETDYSRVETNGAAVRETVVVSLVRSAIHQGEDLCLFPRVIERMKPSDFIDTANGIESVEKSCVAGGKLARLKVTATQIRVAK